MLLTWTSRTETGCAGFTKRSESWQTRVIAFAGCPLKLMRW